MLSVGEAQKCIIENARPLPPLAVPLDHALGKILAEDVASDLDMPPFDKALMDGYAVRLADLGQGAATLTVIEEVPAGKVPTRRLEPGQATRIMTGAPIPEGCDAVVMVERTRMLDASRVQIDDRPRFEQNLLRRGREMRKGAVVLRTGQLLRPQEIGLLASVGRVEVKVVPSPRVAILPTGDELVPVAQVPAAGQIRNSNGAMLLAQATLAGSSARLLDIARDDVDSLRSLIAEGLGVAGQQPGCSQQPGCCADVLILTGGVSAGKLDLVPGVLADMGVKVLVHKVLMKPGKPMLFGCRASTLVFGLPGNPVGAAVCFDLFVAPALRLLAGHAEAGPFWQQAILAEDYAFRTDRPTYHPVRIAFDGPTLRFRPIPWFGSPDLAGSTRANGLALFPVGDQQYKAGQVFEVLRWAQ